MDLKEKIKSSVSLTEVCDRLGIALTDSGGGELRALCPLHNEDTPSFYVNESKGFFHCFGCGEGGDVISLVQKTQGLSFKESLITIAEWFGIEFSEESIGKQRSIIKSSQEIFIKNADVGIKYLAQRGISEGTARMFGVGYATENYINELSKAGFQIDEMEEIGLASKMGRPIFAGYVTIPLYNTAGILVGISGRATSGQEPKYMTTRRSSSFDKRKFIFATNLAREHIKSTGEAVIAEGQLDAMSLHQAGINNAVAILGSSFSLSHALALARMGAHRIVAITDSDEAGSKAAMAIFNIADSIGVSAKAVVLPKGSDPNDILVKRGEKHLVDTINSNKKSKGEFLIYLAQINAEKAGNSVEFELANILANVNRYDPAYKEAIEKAEELLGINAREFKSYLSKRINLAKQKTNHLEEVKEEDDFIAKALVRCPTTGSVDLLSSVHDKNVVSKIADTLPIEEGEPCENVVKLYKELSFQKRLDKLKELKKRASKGDTEALIEMAKINAELQAIREDLL